ncbi:IclR family transcriptional regulator domain-containing protein [Pseudorhodoplanes sp.]|uniref:IclR family transcriptional regulator domain-containing protein n=1 Tax=Pseudorhodoplanes sp. TaxID=1934341 RepID=UPI003D0CFA7B
MRSFKPVIAFLRGLEILRIVNAEKAATIRAIHAQTKFDKATILRMLETLEHGGYVIRDAESPVYYATARTLSLSQGFDRHLWMGRIAEPVLGRFRNEIGWPSDLAICDTDQMIVVQTTRNQGPLSFNRRPGFRAPVLATSLGRAYLAFCDNDERERTLEHIIQRSDRWNELARHPRKLKQMLDQVRSRGFGVMDEEYSERIYSGSIWAMAVPVRTKTKVFGAMNIMMLSSVVSPQEGVRKYLEPLQRAADQLADVLDSGRTNNDDHAIDRASIKGASSASIKRAKTARV